MSYEVGGEFESFKPGQKRLVKNLLSNKATNVKAFLVKEDNRPESEFKQSYGMIRVEWEENGRKMRTHVTDHTP